MHQSAQSLILTVRALLMDRWISSGDIECATGLSLWDIRTTIHRIGYDQLVFRRRKATDRRTFEFRILSEAVRVQARPTSSEAA